jgi:hypothetical protein
MVTTQQLLKLQKKIKQAKFGNPIFRNFKDYFSKLEFENFLKIIFGQIVLITIN